MVMLKNKKIIAFAAAVLSLSFMMSSCSVVNKIVEKSNKENNEKVEKLLKSKGKHYDIDPDDAEVMEGGTYFKVYIDTLRSYEDMEDHVITFRNWLRYAYGELGNRYSVQFYDRDYPEVWYAGFSDHNGFDSEYYWDDERIMRTTYFRIDLMSSTKDKYSKTTPEEYYEISGIDEEGFEEIRERYHEVFTTYKVEAPDKDEHDYAFIPGDTIQHREKFVIGDKDCDIEPGTYEVDMQGYYGVIHITDEDDETKYRLDATYKDGHSDAYYDYEAIPAEIELEEGDIIYITNCMATFDLIDD